MAININDINILFLRGKGRESEQREHQKEGKDHKEISVLNLAL